MSLLDLKVAPIQTEGNKKAPRGLICLNRVTSGGNVKEGIAFFFSAHEINISLYCLCLQKSTSVGAKPITVTKNALCKNTEGSFTCTCNRGYKGDGKKCRGIYLALFKGGFPASRNFYVRRRFSFKYVYKITAMYQRLRVNVKLEPRSTFTRGLSYIASRALTASIIFTRVHFTCVRT